MLNGGTKPGQVVYEIYFNVEGFNSNYQLYNKNQPSAFQPLSASKYMTLW